MELQVIDKEKARCRNELGVMMVKFKEKDQECKLQELKYRELKKQVPHTRLKPLGSQKKSVPMMSPFHKESMIKEMIRHDPNTYANDVILARD